jgi:hypothetical protein
MMFAVLDARGYEGQGAVRDILDVAVEHLASDDYNHVPLAVLQERLARIRRTHAETKLYEAADRLIDEVRDALSEANDPAYGPEDDEDWS